MRTFPLYADDGRLHAFEITSSWVFYWPMFKVLRSVPGVTDVKRQWFNDDRVVFEFRGHKAVVNEPWGDNSRYWVGFEEPEISKQIDLTPLHEAFKAYTGKTIIYSTQVGSNGT